MHRPLPPAPRSTSISAKFSLVNRSWCNGGIDPFSWSIARRKFCRSCRTPNYWISCPTPNRSNCQQPPYAKNWHRSVKPEYGVLVGICTHLGCIPGFDPLPNATQPAANWLGGYFCPCHGSKYDLAGRVFRNVPAPYNLPVPPYHFVNDTMIRIGENPPGVDFDFAIDPADVEAEADGVELDRDASPGLCSQLDSSLRGTRLHVSFGEEISPAVQFSAATLFCGRRTAGNCDFGVWRLRAGLSTCSAAKPDSRENAGNGASSLVLWRMYYSYW